MSKDDALTKKLTAFYQRHETLLALVFLTGLALYWGISKGVELHNVWWGMAYAAVIWLFGMWALQTYVAMRRKSDRR